MNLSRQYTFWGSLSPLGGLTGAGLLIMASARLSWAIIIAGSLFWVYGLSAFSFSLAITYLGKKFFPVKGRETLYTCIAAFFGGVYLLLFWIMCPLATLEVFMLLLLVPMFCASSGIIKQITLTYEKSQGDVFEHVSDTISQAVSLAVLLIAFSIIREPLSYCSLSFPGTYQGLITIMYFSENSFFPISIFKHSAGALLLLGYITCLYQHGKNKFFPGENQ